MPIPVYSLNKSIERQEANNPGLSDILNRVFCLSDTCITKTVGRGSALHQYIYQSCEQLASLYLFKDRPCYRGKINYFQLRFNTNRRTVSPTGQALWQAQAVALLQRDCGINPKQHKSSPTATRQVTSSTIIFSVIQYSVFTVQFHTPNWTTDLHGHDARPNCSLRYFTRRSPLTWWLAENLGKQYLNSITTPLLPPPQRLLCCSLQGVCCVSWSTRLPLQVEDLMASFHQSSF